MAKVERKRLIVQRITVARIAKSASNSVDVQSSNMATACKRKSPVTRVKVCE